MLQTLVAQQAAQIGDLRTQIATQEHGGGGGGGGGGEDDAGNVIPKPCLLAWSSKVRPVAARFFYRKCLSACSSAKHVCFVFLDRRDYGGGTVRAIL